MDRKELFIFGIVFLIVLMFTGCAWHDSDHASRYHNLGSGFGYYGYPQGYEGEEYPVFDEHRHHHHH